MLKTVVAAACLAGIPTVALAQAAIVGSVTDSSGAPLPGVAVEATSDALIEKARATTSDADGRYRIEDLRPGIYSVQFTLAGWKTLTLAGVELTGSFTAPADARLSLGPLSDAVTIVADVPAVDTHSAKREVTLAGELVRSLPIARSYNAVLVLVPGVVTNNNNIVTGPVATSFPLHGGRAQEGRLMLDGFNVGSPPSGNSATVYDVDVGQVDEVTFTTSGALGESETAGLVMNVIPKAGGNRTHGSAFASGTAERLQSSNLTPELLAQQVAPVAPLSKVYDLSGTVGGPIATDRLWYFANAHLGGSTRNSTNVYYNRNAGDSGAWRYVPDTTRLSYSDRTFERGAGRLTWQITPRNKISGFWDAQTICRTCTGATPGQAEPQQISPEAVGVLGRRLDVTQASWSSPFSNRLLFEAGYGGTFFGVGNFEREPNPTRDLVRVVEQCASGCATNGNIPGLTYRSQDFSVAHTGSYLWKGSVAFVSGMQTLKAGYQQTLMTDDRTWMTNDQSLTYGVDNGRPTQLTQSISPWVNNARVAWNAVFLQDEWTHRRLTLQAAVRFDRAWSWFPVQQLGPSRFLPTPIVVPETRGVNSYKDITPRFGAAYDLVGNGRTAVKLSIGKFLEGAGASGNYATANPTLRMPQTTPTFGTAGVTRMWDDANRNFVPDCDLSNPAANDQRPSGGDFCGVMSNVNFGRNVLSNSFDPRILSGWGVRPSDWSLTASVQQQIGQRTSVDVTYTRRWYRGFSVADNLALQPSDLNAFSIVAPLDLRLPGGGGYTVSGLYDVVPEKAGQINNYMTDSKAYGQWYQYFNGIDVTLNARIAKRFTVVGGTSTGQTVADNCAVRGRLPELATTTTGTTAFGAGLMASAVTPLSPYCHVAYGILTQLRGLSSFVVPRIDVQLAATFQSKPGPLLAASYAVPNSAVVPSLGRNLSGNAMNVTVNLIPPGSLYGDRINQLDLRAGKSLKWGQKRTLFAVDIYNALNSSAILTYNNAFVPGGPWLQPLTILTPRLVRITAELEW
jgi:carboxypeptidase family protein